MGDQSQRPTGPAAFLIDPKLVEAREQARQRLVQRLQPRKATLDPKLAEIRDQTRKKEQSLRGRSLRKPPPTSR